MMKEHWALLHLFGEEAEGGNETSDLTPQTTGDDTCASDAGEPTGNRERQEQFRALMEGEYKDLFTAYFQETFNRRFREQKEMKEAFEKNRATLRAAAAYFGVSEEELPQCVAQAAKQTQPKGEAPDGEALRSEIEQAVARALTLARGEIEQQILGGIRARGLRPGESALSDSARDALQRRACGLSRAERAELARRAALGEEIKF